MTGPWVRRLGVASVAVVALVAAIVSYSHMHDVAERAGEGWRAWIEPLSVDGLLVGASLVVTTRWHARLAWLAVAVGILVSLAANLAAAEPNLVSRLVAAWPAVALSYETLLSLAHTSTHQVVEQPSPAEHQEPGNDEQLSPVNDQESGGTDDFARLLPQARQKLHQARQDGRQLGRHILARELATSHHMARRLIEDIRREHHVQAPRPHLVMGPKG